MNGDNITRGIKQDWVDNTGPCGGCDVRDPSGGFRPMFGAFNTSAPIFLVGHTPGEGEFGTSKKSRKYFKKPGNYKPSMRRIYEKEKYQDKFLGEWCTNLSPLFYQYQSSLINPHRSVYITNLLKCPRLSSEAEGTPKKPELCNESGYQSCSKHLEIEVQVGQPDVVSVFGQSAWRRFVEIFNLDAPTSPFYSAVISDGEFAAYLTEFESVSVPVVPSYHWSFFQQGGGNGVLERFDWESDDLEYRYFSELAQKLASFTDNPNDWLTTDMTNP